MARDMDWHEKHASHTSCTNQKRFVIASQWEREKKMRDHIAIGLYAIWCLKLT